MQCALRRGRRRERAGLSALIETKMPVSVRQRYQPISRNRIVTIATRLTRRFHIKHPIVVAPMTPAAGGALASAVAAAGGLGLLGCGYVDLGTRSKPNGQR